MAKKKVSRGRGPRVSEKQLERMVALYLEGKTFKTIAKEVGRHWQTVRKYTTKALQEREGQELRREALKTALVEHFQDLVGALGSLVGLLVLPKVEGREIQHGWRPAGPGRRDRLLLEALRDSHARESPLWSWWDGWNQRGEAYGRALSPFRLKVAREIPRLERSLPGVSIGENLSLVQLRRGLSIAQGSPMYDPSMLQVRPPGAEEGAGEGEELWLAQSTRLAGGRDMHRLLEKVSGLMKGMRNWKEVKELARLYGEMGEIKEKIEEEVEVLSLRRAFPGRCRLCPV